MKNIFRISMLVLFALLIGFGENAFAGKKSNKSKSRRRTVGHTGKVVRMGKGNKLSKYTATKPLATESHTAAPVNNAALLSLIASKNAKAAAKEKEKANTLWSK